MLPPPHPVFAPGTSAEVIASYEDLEDIGGFDAFNFSDNGRWSSTVTNGGGLAQGDATTITWSFAQDGSPISGYNGEPSAPSNLRAFLGNIYGTNASSSRAEDQPWFDEFQAVFERWGAVSGVTYVYEANDDGAAIGPSANGVQGVRGDVRISGHYIDGPSNVLAYNFYPTVGDMILDTGDTFYNNTSGNSLRLRNTVAHEAGHGLGLGHVTPTNGTKLMEPSITLGFDGPQLDDILAANRGYGDRLEKNGGNNVVATAYNLGTSLSSFTVDTVSIDDDADLDYYRFTVSSATSLNVNVIPIGSTYSSNGTNFNALAQSDLALSVYGTNGTTLIASANITPAGGSESLSNVLLPGSGTYYVRVTGSANAAQLYKLTGTMTPTTPIVGPEIQVLEGANDITDNTGNVSFGSTITGSPSSKSFTITNQGTTTLTIGSSISLPAGFTLTQAPGTSAIAPGGSTNFVVSLGTAVIGTYGGQISFTNNDTDENPFNFNISGEVTAVPVTPTLPFTDDFNRLNNASLGSNWTERIGDLAIVSGGLQSNATSASIATVNDLTPADVVVSGDVNVGAGTANRSLGLVARYSGSGDGNWYLGNIRYTGGAYRAEIWKQVNGGQTLLTSTFLDSGAGSVRFEVVGTSLKLFFNDTLVGNVNDTQLTQGGIGIRTNFLTGLSVDNFSATAPNTVLAPEIQVGDGATDIADNTGSVNLGSTITGDSLTRTFTVTNQGTSDLNLGTILVSGGFILSQGFSATTLAPNASTTFIVSLNTATLGTYSGQISFTNNDADENPFNFNISGEVTAVPVTPTLPFTDDFNRLNNTSLGSNWTERIGDLAIVSGGLQSNATSASIATVSELTPADVVLSGDVNVGAGTDNRSLGLVARYSGSGDGNWYLGNIRYTGGAYRAEIWKQVNGGQTLLTSTFLDSGAGSVRFEVVGTSLRLFFNDTLVGNVNDTQLTQGGIGIRTNFLTGLSVDNFAADVPVLAPEIQVGDGATDIADNTGNVNFGSTTTGNSLSRTFTVTNQGTSNLTLGTISLPNGFTLAQGFGATTLAPNASASFVVSLNATTVGTYSGQVSFTNNDADESPFNFNISGAITAPAPGQSFADNFNRANSTALGSSWTERVGNLSIASNGLAASTSSVSLATVNNFNTADVVVSGDINVGTGSANRSLGLVARHSGSGDGNWYLGNIRYTGGAYRAEIWKQVNGVQTLLTSTYLSGGNLSARFEVVGTSLKLYVNNTLVGNTIDSQLATGGIGVRTNFISGVRIDNYTATTVANATHGSGSSSAGQTTNNYAQAVDRALVALYEAYQNNRDTQKKETTPWWLY